MIENNEFTWDPQVIVVSADDDYKHNVFLVNYWNFHFDLVQELSVFVTPHEVTTFISHGNPHVLIIREFS